MNFAIFRGVAHDDPRRPHIFTITDSSRLPRALWDRFKADADRRGDKTIDALRRALELYIEQERKP